MLHLYHCVNMCTLYDPQNHLWVLHQFHKVNTICVINKNQHMLTNKCLIKSHIQHSSCGSPTECTTICTGASIWIGLDFSSITTSRNISERVFQLKSSLNTFIYDFLLSLNRASQRRYRPPTKLREGDIFSGMCPFTGSCPMLPLPMMHWTHPKSDPTVQGPLPEADIWWSRSKAGDVHPTGIFSC